MYAFCKEEDDEKVFIFLGYNYLMECIYEEELNVFDVLKFRKVVPIDRDRLRKRYAQVVGKVRFVDKKFAHREPKNDSIEIKNTIITQNIFPIIMLRMNIRVSMVYGATFYSW